MNVTVIWGATGPPPENKSPGDGESTRTKPLAGSERAFVYDTLSHRDISTPQKEGA